ncbi:MAG: BTB/POZ domain-containing protein [Parachlamydiaceae bacterium]
MNPNLDLCSSASMNSESRPRSRPIRTQSSQDLHRLRPRSQDLPGTQPLSPKRISRLLSSTSSFSALPKTPSCYDEIIEKIFSPSPLKEPLSNTNTSWRKFFSYLFKQSSNYKFDVFARVLEREDVSKEEKGIFISEFLNRIDINQLDTFFRLRGNGFILFPNGEKLKVHRELLAWYIPYFKSVQREGDSKIQLNKGTSKIFYLLLDHLIVNQPLNLNKKNVLPFIGLCNELDLQKQVQHCIEWIINKYGKVFFDYLPAGSKATFFTILLKCRGVRLDFKHACFALLVDCAEVSLEFKQTCAQKLLGQSKHQLNEFFAQEGDSSIYFGKEEMRVHQGLLALYIPYFASLDKKKDAIEPNCIEIKTFSLLIQSFIFDKKVRIDKKNLPSLLALGGKLGLDELLQECQDWVDANLTLREKAGLLSKLKSTRGNLDDFKLHLILAIGADIENLKQLKSILKDIREYTLPHDIPLNIQEYIIKACDKVEVLSIHASQSEPLEYISKHIHLYKNLKQLLIHFDTSTPYINPYCLIQLDSTKRIGITLNALSIDTNFLQLLPQMSLIRSCTLKQCVLQEKILSQFPTTIEQLLLMSCFKEDGVTRLDETEIQILPSHLQVLELSSVNLGEGSFQRIQHLPLNLISLEKCHFPGTFQDIRHMKGLSLFRLTNCHVTKKGLQSLKSLGDIVEVRALKVD